MMDMYRKKEVDQLYELLPFGSFALGTNDQSSDLDLVLCTYGSSSDKEHHMAGEELDTDLTGRATTSSKI